MKLSLELNYDQEVVIDSISALYNISVGHMITLITVFIVWVKCAYPLTYISILSFVRIQLIASVFMVYQYMKGWATTYWQQTRNDFWHRFQICHVWLCLYRVTLSFISRGMKPRTLQFKSAWVCPAARPFIHHPYIEPSFIQTSMYIDLYSHTINSFYLPPNT